MPACFAALAMEPNAMDWLTVTCSCCAEAGVGAESRESFCFFAHPDFVTLLHDYQIECFALEEFDLESCFRSEIREVLYSMAVLGDRWPDPHREPLSGSSSTLGQPTYEQLRLQQAFSLTTTTLLINHT